MAYHWRYSDLWRERRWAHLKEHILYPLRQVFWTSFKVVLYDNNWCTICGTYGDVWRFRWYAHLKEHLFLPIGSKFSDYWKHNFWFCWGGGHNDTIASVAVLVYFSSPVYGPHVAQAYVQSGTILRTLRRANHPFSLYARLCLDNCFQINCRNSRVCIIVYRRV